MTGLTEYCAAGLPFFTILPDGATATTFDVLVRIQSEGATLLSECTWDSGGGVVDLSSVTVGAYFTFRAKARTLRIKGVTIASGDTYLYPNAVGREWTADFRAKYQIAAVYTIPGYGTVISSVFVPDSGNYMRVYADSAMNSSDGVSGLGDYASGTGYTDGVLIWEGLASTGAGPGGFIPSGGGNASLWNVSATYSESYRNTAYIACSGVVSCTPTLAAYQTGTAFSPNNYYVDSKIYFDAV